MTTRRRGRPQSRPSVDRSQPTWRGYFPGVGEVQVRPDGAVTVDPEGDSEELAQALRLGWGDLLSFARRGFGLALGACVTPPDFTSSSLLVAGGIREVSIVVLEITERGWSLLSDRPTPMKWQSGVLTAHPRPAPLIVQDTLASAMSMVGTPLRHQSNAMAVQVSRSSDPAPVAGIIHVQTRLAGEAPVAPVVGARRLERAANLMLTGALAPADATGGPEGSARHRGAGLAEDLQIARIPAAIMRIDGLEDSIARDLMLDWWAGQSNVDDRQPP